MWNKLLSVLMFCGLAYIAVMAVAGVLYLGYAFVINPMLNY